MPTPCQEISDILMQSHSQFAATPDRRDGIAWARNGLEFLCSDMLRAKPLGEAEETKTKRPHEKGDKIHRLCKLSFRLRMCTADVL
jgi:hypothetical protein